MSHRIARASPPGPHSLRKPGRPGARLAACSSNQLRTSTVFSANAGLPACSSSAAVGMVAVGGMTGEGGPAGGSLAAGRRQPGPVRGSRGCTTSSVVAPPLSPRKQRANRKPEKPVPPFMPANRQAPSSASTAAPLADLRACAQVRADSARAPGPLPAGVHTVTGEAPGPPGRPPGSRPTRSSTAGAARKGPDLVAAESGKMCARPARFSQRMRACRRRPRDEREYELRQALSPERASGQPGAVVVRVRAVRPWREPGSRVWGRSSRARTPPSPARPTRGWRSSRRTIRTRGAGCRAPPWPDRSRPSCGASAG